MKLRLKSLLERSTVLVLLAGITGYDFPPNGPDQQRMETFSEPPVVTATGGVLRITLSAKRSMITVGGHRTMVETYNDRYVPSTLRVRPGDTIRIRLANALAEPTNLHTHGLTVSPAGNSDNIFLGIRPGAFRDYEIPIPTNHPAGLFWYHPHPHGHSDAQTRNAMSGALIVDGLLDPFPALRRVRERLLLLKDLQVENGKVSLTHIGQNTIRTVNGIVDPVIVMRPGETELWRIGNIGADLYYSLGLDGHVFQLVARDGQRRSRIATSDSVRLSPGARAEVLVTAGAPGVYQLRTRDIDTGPGGNQYKGTVLATLRVEGNRTTHAALPAELLPVEDLRGKVTNRRTIVYTESSDGNTFFIDGKAFDMSRTDIRVKLGAVEEWTIQNKADELHTFHIHQGPFQVTEINGVAQPTDDHRDIVDVPIGGEVKVIIPFTNPLILGRFVYHCHILSHEDKGMMGTIEVTR